MIQDEELRSKVSPIKIALSVVAFIILAVLLLPLTQLVTYTLFIEHPEIWQYGIISTLIVGLAVKASPDQMKGSVAMTGLVFIMISTLLIGPFVASINTQTDLADDIESNAEGTNTTIPESSNDSVRVLPRTVADEYARSTLQTQKYGVGDSDPVYHNGDYQWGYPLEPDRVGVTFFGKQDGAVYVNMEQSSQNVTTVREERFDCGVGMLWFDSYNYKTTLDRLDVDRRQDSRFVFQGDDGNYRIAQSYVTHEWRFSLTPLPTVYSVPQYGGTQVADTNCNIESVSANEVSEYTHLDKQSTYPYDLAMYRVNSMQLTEGVFNKWFVGENVPEVAEVPGKGNSQPFTVPTEDGLKMYVAAEPSGSGQGIYQIYIFDAQTGEIQRVEFDESRLGPQRAADKLRTERPNVNWKSGESGTTEISEPIPVTKNGTLYWHVKAVPTDSIGISFSAFVNTETGAVTTIRNDKEIYAFVSRDEVRNMDDPTDNTTAENSTSTTTVTVAVVNENGTVTRTEEVTLPENGSVEIEVED